MRGRLLGIHSVRVDGAHPRLGPAPVPPTDLRELSIMPASLVASSTRTVCSALIVAPARTFLSCRLFDAATSDVSVVVMAQEHDGASNAPEPTSWMNRWKRTTAGSTTVALE